MTDAPDSCSADDLEWRHNYFNYFTEIEEHFQRARGTGLFLLSPLDWALIENWKNSNVPLEAVLKGIDEAFEKWRSRKSRRKQINSLAYCGQAVMEAAQRLPSSSGQSTNAGELPFSEEEIQAHLQNAATCLRNAPDLTLQGIGSTLQELAHHAGQYVHKLEDLERRLTAMEDRVVATLRVIEGDEGLAAIRKTLDEELRPYRGKMTADQLALLERRYVDTALLSHANLPRLSLFYLS